MTQPSQAPLDGIVNVHKEAGWTSHDVVARVRKLVRQKRVGHAGTLDPAATGVLPVCLGQATRVVDYLSASGKAYRATITFGVATDTYDAEGAIVAQQPVPTGLDQAAIAAVLPNFLGEIQQVPPVYSALKRDGQRMYDLARQGIVVEMEPRPVWIDDLRIIAWETPTLTLEIECGKGTYIRSLAHDLGIALGTVAHLATLVRTRVGPFKVRDAITLDQLAEALANDSWRDHLFAPDEALLHLNAAIIAPPGVERFFHGGALRFQQVNPAAIANQTMLRAYSTDGRFLGLLTPLSEGAWHPDKVFAAQPVE